MGGRPEIQFFDSAAPLPSKQTGRHPTPKLLLVQNILPPPKKQRATAGEVFAAVILFVTMILALIVF